MCMKKELLIGLLAFFMTFGLTSCASDGKTPYIGENGNWWIGETDTGVPATGPSGQEGKNGEDGTSVTVVSVEKTSSNGLVDTYTITFSDGTTSTFTVTNGESSVVESIELTSSSGLTDTYTITFTNGSIKTFTVTNGKDGDNLTITSIELKSSEGLIDTYVINYSDGSKFEFVVSNGEDGKTPYIGDNGNWWIGDQDTGVLADGEKLNDIPLTLFSTGLQYKVETIGNVTGYVVTGTNILEYDDEYLLALGYDDIDLYENEHCVIPNYIGNIPVIGVGPDSGLNFDKITLSKNTIYLGAGAFNGCSNLKEIDFHGSQLIAIPNHCFCGTKLTSVQLPETVTHVFDYAFDGVPLRSMNLEHIKYIGKNAFDDAFFDYVYLTNNVEFVGTHAFDSTFVYVEADEEPATWTFNSSSALVMACGVKNNGEYLYSINNNEVTVYQYLGAETKLTIPATIDNKPVTTIGSGFNSLILDEDLFPGMTLEEICSYLKNPTGYISELIVGNNVKKIDKLALLNGSMFVYLKDSVEEVFVSSGDGVIGTYTCFGPDDVPMALVVVEDSSKTMFRYGTHGLKTYEELLAEDDDYEAIIKANIDYDDIYFDTNKDFYYTRNITGFEVLAYKGINEQDIIVPNTFDNLPVNSIARFAFYYTSFNKLTVGSNVSKIKTCAFFSAKGKIYIPGGVSIINANAMLLKSGSEIYTEVVSKPDEWDSCWNPNSIGVVYSTSLEDFNNL